MELERRTAAPRRAVRRGERRSATYSRITPSNAPSTPHNRIWTARFTAVVRIERPRTRGRPSRGGQSVFMVPLTRVCRARKKERVASVAGFKNSILLSVCEGTIVTRERQKKDVTLTSCSKVVRASRQQLSYSTCSVTEICRKPASTTPYLQAGPPQNHGAGRQGQRAWQRRAHELWHDALLR